MATLTWRSRSHSLDMPALSFANFTTVTDASKKTAYLVRAMHHRLGEI
jgi:hypothetical protein